MGLTADQGFQAVLQHIDEELDFATDYYNSSYLERRITARMRRTHVDSAREYLEYLRSQDAEQRALLNSLSINTTSFFRNPAVWDSLRPILHSLSEERRSVPVWSAACSDGREPYSLAMLALEDRLPSEAHVHVTATDISADVLEAARRGIYVPSQTNDIEGELTVFEDPSRYVTHDGDRFKVRQDVKDLVTFQRHDLIRGDPPGQFALVMCRNLFIYIDTDYKSPILQTITDSLDDGGYLVIGRAESLPREFRTRFQPVDKRHRIYRKV